MASLKFLRENSGIVRRTLLKSNDNQTSLSYNCYTITLHWNPWPDFEWPRALKRSPLPEEGRKSSEEFGRGSDPQSCSVCNRLRKVLGIVSQQPIGLAGYRRKKYGYISGVLDQVAA
jgi:hypothetical protein